MMGQAQFGLPPPFPPQVFGWLQDIKGNWMEVPDLELFLREHQ